MSQAVCPPAAETESQLAADLPGGRAHDQESWRDHIQSRWQDSPRIDVHYDRGYPVLDLGTKEIWDGSDLCLLRDTLADLCHRGGASRTGSGACCQAVGIQMTAVKGIPTGFFGMIHDLHLDEQVAVHLLAPQPHICSMLWFRTFCESEGGGEFLLLRDPQPNVIPGAYHFWASLRGEEFCEELSS